MAVKIVVVNKHHRNYHPNTVYVGRGSVLGNKFILGKDGDRNEVLDKYQNWLLGEIPKRKKVWAELQRLLKNAQNHKYLFLECYCAPKRCHADIVKMILERMDQKPEEFD